MHILRDFLRFIKREENIFFKTWRPHRPRIFSRGRTFEFHFICILRRLLASCPCRFSGFRYFLLLLSHVGEERAARRQPGISDIGAEKNLEPATWGQVRSTFAFILRGRERKFILWAKFWRNDKGNDIGN